MCAGRQQRADDFGNRNASWLAWLAARAPFLLGPKPAPPGTVGPLMNTCSQHLANTVQWRHKAPLPLAWRLLMRLLSCARLANGKAGHRWPPKPQETPVNPNELDSEPCQARSRPRTAHPENRSPMHLCAPCASPRRPTRQESVAALAESERLHLQLREIFAEFDNFMSGPACARVWIGSSRRAESRAPSSRRS
jgi:hypothetical protein